MLEFHITTSANHADDLSAQLYLLGAVAVSLQDSANQPIYEPLPGEIIIWQQVTIVALFVEVDSLALIKTYLTQRQEEGMLSDFKMIAVPQQDWVGNTLKSFQALQFGNRLWICPSWQKPPMPEAINVLLDPGLAFGTGTHPTTALCLAWLDENIKGQETIIDYGCGSGILSMAALKLGAVSVTAVDHDNQALTACKKNAELNQISEARVQICEPEKLPRQKVDILLANILATPLISLAAKFAELVKPGGRIVLSGILVEQIAAVNAAYESDFTMGSPAISNEWARLDGIRNSIN